MIQITLDPARMPNNGHLRALATFLLAIAGNDAASAAQAAQTIQGSVTIPTPAQAFAGSGATDSAPDDDDDAEQENAPPAPVTPGEVDAKGYPWDDRIHAASKGKVKDGTWRLKQGVDKTVVDAVRAEATRNAAAAHAASVTAAAPVPVDPTAAAYQAAGGVLPVPTPAAVAAAAPQPVPVPAPPTAAPAPTPAAAGESPFMVFMKTLNAAAANDKEINARANAAAQALGLASLVGLNVNQALIPTIAAEIGLAL